MKEVNIKTTAADNIEIRMITALIATRKDEIDDINTCNNAVLIISSTTLVTCLEDITEINGTDLVD
jgi:hypothetical protein